MTERLLSIGKTAKMLGMTSFTLRRSSREFLDYVKTEGGHRRYRESDISRLQGIQENVSREDNTVCIYCRVSSNTQKMEGDLDRQKLRLLDYCIRRGYKVVNVFEEVGSGMSDKRPKINKIMDLAKENQFSKLVVEHKDRLSRFNINVYLKYFSVFGISVEFVEDILPKTFENELVEDMISLMSSFSAKLYGKRSSENRKKNVRLSNEDKS